MQGEKGNSLMKGLNENYRFITIFSVFQALISSRAPRTGGVSIVIVRDSPGRREKKLSEKKEGRMCDPVESKIPA